MYVDHRNSDLFNFHRLYTRHSYPVLYFMRGFLTTTTTTVGSVTSSCTSTITVSPPRGSPLHSPTVSDNSASDIPSPECLTLPEACTRVNGSSRTELLLTKGSASRRYVDITEYLCMPQKDAAAKLGMKNTTLSKHFAAVVHKERKWPYRRIKQLDKEILLAKSSVPAGMPVPPGVEEKIRVLTAKRQLELKPVPKFCVIATQVSSCRLSDRTRPTTAEERLREFITMSSVVPFDVNSVSTKDKGCCCRREWWPDGTLGTLSAGPLLHICGFLDNKALVAFQLVCKTWWHFFVSNEQQIFYMVCFHNDIKEAGENVTGRHFTLIISEILLSGKHNITACATDEYVVMSISRDGPAGRSVHLAKSICNNLHTLL
ncbi:hypothetical protein Pelo_15290 [Pelomyxa schiedti]|nr:hypothetical protein Pelo_15290 [Pelomyxa schiedti]